MPRNLVSFACVPVLVTLLGLAPGGYGETRLIDAVRAGNVERVRQLVELQVDVNERQADGATALHWAVYQDNLEIATALIEAGADVGAANAFGVVPLFLACENGSSRLIRSLLDAGADANSATSSGETALMAAARAGGVDGVMALVAAGADLDAREPSQHQTALMWAISAGHADVARGLIQGGASTSAATKRGFTPLLFAIREGDLDTARFLLDGGADVDTVAGDGNSALLIATLRGHVELAEVLLDRGADPNADGAGYTALHWAVGSWETELTGNNGIAATSQREWQAMSGVPERKLELVQALLEHGADPNVRLQRNPRRYGYTVYSSRPRGSTPYMLAALAGDVEIMSVLVEHGADPLLAADNGVTALMMAAGVRRNLSEITAPLSASLEAVEHAVASGIDVNAADTDWGDTALHGAARIKSVEIVQHLVDHGAEVNVVNKRGQTPLFFAERHWPLAMTTIFKRSAAGDLLRKLSTPDVVVAAQEDWGALPSASGLRLRRCWKRGWKPLRTAKCGETRTR